MGNIYGSEFDAGVATAELGETWWIRRNYFKRFATGRYAHGALDLTEKLASRLKSRLSASSIDRIDVETFFWAATLSGQTVRTPFGLRFSLPMAIARRIIHGPVPLTDDGAHAFADAQVAALAARTYVVEAKAFTDAYPDRQPTRMTVKFRDGTTESLSAERILGECDYPLPEAILQAKFVELVEQSWGAGAVAAWRDLARIEEIEDVSLLITGWHPDNPTK
jgi:2-methylcitrate dehydratase PrpD